MLDGAIITAGVLLLVAIDSYRHRWLNLLSPVWPLLLWCGLTLVWWPAAAELRGELGRAEAILGHVPDGLELCWGFGLANCGIIAWYMGFRSRWGRRKARATRIPDFPANARLSVVVGLVFLVLGVYSFARYKPLPFETGLHKQVATRLFTDDSAYQVLFWRTVPVVVNLWAATLRSQIPSLGVALALVGAVLYGGWSRSTAYGTMLNLCVIEKLQKRRRVLFASLLLLLPLFVVMHQRLSSNRQYMAESLQGGSWEPSSTGSAHSQMDEFGDFAFLLSILDIVPAKVGHTYGMQFLYDNFLEAIPRLVWADKGPVLVPGNYDTVLEITRGGPTSTVFAELYIEGGAFAVLLVLAVYGMLSRLVYELGARNGNNWVVAAVYPSLYTVLSSWRTAPGILMPVLLLAPIIVVVAIARFSYARRRGLMRAANQPRCAPLGSGRAIRQQASQRL